MGAFNTVRKLLPCPTCGYDLSVDVQFKYGNTWQLQYSIGDELRWDGNNVGNPSAKRVVVDGVAHLGCPRCGCDADVDFYVFVTDNKIVGVDVADGTFRFSESHYVELP